MSEKKRVFCPTCGRELHCQVCDVESLKKEVENLKLGDVIRAFQNAFGEKKKGKKRGEK